LSGNDNIQNEKHYVANNIQIFFLMKNDEFVCSVDKISAPSVMQKRFLDTEGGRKHNIIKFCFLPYFQASASTKNVQWEYGLCTFSIYWIYKRGLGGEPAA